MVSVSVAPAGSPRVASEASPRTLRVGVGAPAVRFAHAPPRAHARHALYKPFLSCAATAEAANTRSAARFNAHARHANAKGRRNVASALDRIAAPRVAVDANRRHAKRTRLRTRAATRALNGANVERTAERCAATLDHAENAARREAKTRHGRNAPSRTKRVARNEAARRAFFRSSRPARRSLARAPQTASALRANARVFASDGLTPAPSRRSRVAHASRHDAKTRRRSARFRRRRVQTLNHTLGVRARASANRAATPRALAAAAAMTNARKPAAGRRLAAWRSAVASRRACSRRAADASSRIARRATRRARIRDAIASTLGSDASPNARGERAPPTRSKTRPSASRPAPASPARSREKSDAAPSGLASSRPSRPRGNIGGVIVGGSVRGVVGDLVVVGGGGGLRFGPRFVGPPRRSSPSLRALAAARDAAAASRRAAARFSAKKARRWDAAALAAAALGSPSRPSVGDPSGAAGKTPPGKDAPDENAAPAAPTREEPEPFAATTLKRLRDARITPGIRAGESRDRGPVEAARPEENPGDGGIVGGGVVSPSDSFSGGEAFAFAFAFAFAVAFAASRRATSANARSAASAADAARAFAASSGDVPSERRDAAPEDVGGDGGEGEGGDECGDAFDASTEVEGVRAGVAVGVAPKTNAKGATPGEGSADGAGEPADGAGEPADGAGEPAD